MQMKIGLKTWLHSVLLISSSDTKLLSLLKPSELVPLFLSFCPWYKTCTAFFVTTHTYFLLIWLQNNQIRRKYVCMVTMKAVQDRSPQFPRADRPSYVMTWCLLFDNLLILSYRMKITVSTHGWNQHLLISWWLLDYTSITISCLTTLLRAAEIPHLHLFSLSSS